MAWSSSSISAGGPHVAVRSPLIVLDLRDPVHDFPRLGGRRRDDSGPSPSAGGRAFSCSGFPKSCRLAARRQWISASRCGSVIACSACHRTGIIMLVYLPKRSKARWAENIKSLEEASASVSSGRVTASSKPAEEAGHQSRLPDCLRDRGSSANPGPRWACVLGDCSSPTKL